MKNLFSEQHQLTEADIRELHKVLLVEPYYADAQTLDELPTKRLIQIGQYKSMPNSVQTSTGEMHFYASPEETPAQMGDLMQWIIAMNWIRANFIRFCWRRHSICVFVGIHPFDDGEWPDVAVVDESDFDAGWLCACDNQYEF